LRLFGWFLGGLGGVLLLLGLLWFGYGLYIELAVAANPATALTFRTADGEVRLGAYSGGDQVAPASETPSPTPVAEAAAIPVAERAALTPTSVPTVPPVLPPLRLRVAKIAVDTPVVLANNENLPKYRGVGWFIGTGYPGFRGNVVLFGHLNGEYETFARLDELRPGDEAEILTASRSYRYVVDGSRVVTAEAVEVLAPSSDRRLTLITCSGTFEPQTRNYSHRLIVSARLAESGQAPSGPTQPPGR